jgi:lysophospholipase L1-like esterase
MQIGQDRSGFYSYTFLENAVGSDMPKVERLVPEWKPRAVGETVWFATPKRFSGQGRMIAAVVEPQRSFVMVGANDWASLRAGKPAHEGFWSFTLEPLGNNQCRLIARVRGGTPPTLASRAVGRLFWEPMHFVMEQKMLRTIRDLSEKG